MYRKLLVPLDGSEFSECTLEHVKEVVSAHGVSDVVLLTVVEPLRQVAVSYLGDEQVEGIETQSRESAREYLQSVAKRLDLPTAVHSEQVPGQPAAQILDFIEKNGVDLVIMSSHGRSGPSKWFLGSVAERVLQHSPVPVFLIPSLVCRMSG